MLWKQHRATADTLAITTADAERQHLELVLRGIGHMLRDSIAEDDKRHLTDR